MSRVLDREDDRLFEEFSRVNNELATLHRSQAQRNAELLELNETLERRVALRTRHLQQANEELESLAYGMAHELRAPARQVEALTQLVEEGGGALLPMQELSWLRLARTSAIRQSALINDIVEYLVFASDPLVIESIDMRAQVAAVARTLREQRPGATPAWTVEALPPASGDRRLVREILVRLMDNAIKFSAATPNSEITIGVTAHGAGHAYFVRDNGAGFDPASASRLFQPFQRLHAPADDQDTGMGLAVARRLVQRHGGEIWAVSAPGAGATFSFTLGGRDA